jgi:hypothetical protein
MGLRAGLDAVQNPDRPAHNPSLHLPVPTSQVHSASTAAHIWLSVCLSTYLPTHPLPTYSPCWILAGFSIS